MDAKPQRVHRAMSTLGLTNNENVAPSALSSNHQRHKSAGVSVNKDARSNTTIPAKRTAFGDVSNVARSLLPETAQFGLKGQTKPMNIVSVPNTKTIEKETKPANIVPFLSTKTVGKENSGQTAGFIAPAQRIKNTVVENQAQNAGQPGATRKTIVAFRNEIDILDSLSVPVLPAQNATRKSPRHYKSQPCLKDVESQQLLQQPKQLLRRTQSRLPVDRSAFRDVVVFADNSSNANPLDNVDVADLVDAAEDVDESDAVDILQNFDTADAQGASIQSFVDAVDEDGDQAPFLHLPKPLASIENTAISLAQEPNIAQPEPEAYLPDVDNIAPDFLSEIPAGVSSVTTYETDEPWDDDADFYDDQGYTTAHSFRSAGDNTTGGVSLIIVPKVTAKIQNELEIARSIVESSLTPEDIDDEAWDISMVAEYGDDIYNYMKDLESKMLPNPHYMDMQTEIQWSMRAVLMEWLIQVHSRFNLLPETLFLTVNYIDRFLSSKIVSVGKLQLVGATAIFIASKYEEITCPSIQEIIYMVDGGYSTDEILKAERFMLSMLGFELGWPGPMSFLRRISKADEYDLETRTLAKYFLEVSIMDEHFVACAPSFLAAGAHCLARCMLYKGDWTMAHTHYSGYTWSQVRPLANLMLHFCRDPRAHHAAVYEKYASSKFKKASIYVEDTIQQGFVLPSQNSRQRISTAGSFAENVDFGAPLRSSRLDMLIQAES